MSDPAATVPTCYRHPGREAYIRCQRCGRVICPDCMRDSAVGFQCPECVKEGARTTRSGRTAYGGIRSANAALTSMVLIGLNLLVWLAIVASGGNGSKLTDALSLLPTGRCDSGSHPGSFYPSLGSATLCHLQAPGDGHWYPGVSDGAYWQLLSSAFTHVALFHIGFNMLALWVLGPQLEATFGRVRFLAVYLLSALAGSALVYWIGPQHGSTLGASGAIYGLLASLLVIAHKVGANTQQILLWIGLGVVMSFTVSGVSWQGHLGGFAGGLVASAVIAYAPHKNRARFQVAGLLGLLALIVVAVVMRTAALA